MADQHSPDQRVDKPHELVNHSLQSSPDNAIRFLDNLSTEASFSSKESLAYVPLLIARLKSLVEPGATLDVDQQDFVKELIIGSADGGPFTKIDGDTESRELLRMAAYINSCDSSPAETPFADNSARRRLGEFGERFSQRLDSPAEEEIYNFAPDVIIRLAGAVNASAIMTDANLYAVTEAIKEVAANVWLGIPSPVEKGGTHEWSREEPKAMLEMATFINNAGLRPKIAK